MRPEKYVCRVDRKAQEVRPEINPWKVVGWVALLFGLILLGIYVYHLFHGHDPVLEWKPLVFLSGGGMVGGSVLISTGGDWLADAVEKWVERRADDGG